MWSIYDNLPAEIHSSPAAMGLYLHQPAYKEMVSKIKTTKPM